MKTYKVTYTATHHHNMHFRKELPVLEIVSKIERIGGALGFKVLKMEHEGAVVYDCNYEDDPEGGH